MPRGSLQLQRVLETVLRKKPSQTAEESLLTLIPNHPIFLGYMVLPGVASCNSLWFPEGLWANHAARRDHIWPACAWPACQPPDSQGRAQAQFSLCPGKQRDMRRPGSLMSTLWGGQAGPSSACPASGPVQPLGKASSAHRTKPTPKAALRFCLLKPALHQHSAGFT